MREKLHVAFSLSLSVQRKLEKYAREHFPFSGNRRRGNMGKAVAKIIGDKFDEKEDVSMNDQIDRSEA